MSADFTGFELSTYCSVDNLAKIRLYLREKLQNMALKAVDIELIVLAVDEICTNSIVHANECDPRSHIGIRCAKEEDKLIIEVADKGKAYSVENYTEPTLDQLITQKSRGNMGLMIVKKIMDRIEYIQHGGLNICRMQKGLI